MKNKRVLLTGAIIVVGGALVGLVALEAYRIAGIVAGLMLTAALVLCVWLYSSARSLTATSVRRIETRMARIEGQSGRVSDAGTSEVRGEITRAVSAIKKLEGRLSRETDRVINAGGLRSQRMTSLQGAMQLQLDAIEELVKADEVTNERPGSETLERRCQDAATAVDELIASRGSDAEESAANAAREAVRAMMEECRMG